MTHPGWWLCAQKVMRGWEDAAGGPEQHARSDCWDSSNGEGPASYGCAGACARSQLYGRQLYIENQ